MTTTPEYPLSQTSSAPPASTIYSSRAQFPLGKIVATPGALRLLQESGFSAAALISRHVQGFWGDISDGDKAENKFAVARRLRIVSCYRMVDAERLAATPKDKRSLQPAVLLITGADRSFATVLFRDEY